MITRDVSTEQALEWLKGLNPTRVLDVGGAMKPLNYATHVIDILPYQPAPGHMSVEPGTSVQYTEETWTQCDICDIPWPYDYKQFDVVWCTHTLEDLRDPIGVVREISRVGKAGYIVTIPRNYEQQFDVNSPDYAGYVHHRWLIDLDEHDQLRFLFKYPLVHTREFTPTFLNKRELSLWWQDELTAYELHLMDMPAIVAYFDILQKDDEHAYNLALQQ